jgi:hypothetical protein
MAAGAGAARVRRPTSAELAEDGPEVAGLAVAREAQAEEFDGAVVVPLDTDDGVIEVTVPPAEEWRDSAIQAMREGNFGRWAERTLSDDDYAAWVDADPRVRQINGFFEEFGRLTGVTQGESRASRRASPQARRR